MEKASYGQFGDAFKYDTIIFFFSKIFGVPIEIRQCYL